MNEPHKRYTNRGLYVMKDEGIIDWNATIVERIKDKAGNCLTSLILGTAVTIATPIAIIAIVKRLYDISVYGSMYNKRKYKEEKNKEALEYLRVGVKGLT